MDLFPMLAILTAADMRHQMTPLKWTIIVLSCVIGLWGALAFHQLPLGRLTRFPSK